jgi:hypothetical protein
MGMILAHLEREAAAGQQGGRLSRAGARRSVISEQFAAPAAGMAAAEEAFGEVAVLQLVRVMGSAMARLADAMVSAFLVNVEPAARAKTCRVGRRTRQRPSGSAPADG